MLAIHERLLAEHGGAPGILDARLLDSALAGPQNHFAYGVPDLFDLASVYAHALTKDHPFVDGYKRVALTIALSFLEMNGYRVFAPESEAVEVTLDLSSQRAEAATFAEWLRRHSAAIVPQGPVAKKGVRAARKKK